MEVFAEPAFETGSIVVVDIETAGEVFDAFIGLDFVAGLAGKTGVFWSVEDAFVDYVFGAFSEDGQLMVMLTCKACLTRLVTVFTVIGTLGVNEDDHYEEEG